MMMEEDSNKHPLEDGSGVGGAQMDGGSSKKRVRLAGEEKELREWTLLELFDGLAKMGAHQEDDIIDLVSEIRKRLNSPSGLQIVLSEQVKPYLTAGLVSPIPSVRELTLSQLARTATAGAQGLPLLKELWPSIVKSVADDNLKVATTAAAAVLTVAKEPHGLELTFSADSISLFNDMLAGSEVLRLRVLDLFAELSTTSAEAFERAKDFLQILVKELNTKDLLQRMNVIELLEKIAKSDHCVSFLNQSGIPTYLQKLLSEQEDPSFSLLCGSALRLLSSIVRRGKEIHILAPPVLDPVSQLLESRDEACAEAAISFIGALGSTSDGQQILLNRRQVLKSWFEHMTSTISVLRLSALHAFADILSSHDHEKTREIFDIEDKGWNGSSSGEVMRTFMKFLDQPFPELRYATFKAIQSMTLHQWGVRAMFAYPGFLEFLLNRSTDPTKVGKEWKYAIIESLIRRHEENHVRDILAEAAVDLLQAYLSQGVFYQRGEVASKIASKAG